MKKTHLHFVSKRYLKFSLFALLSLMTLPIYAHISDCTTYNLNTANNQILLSNLTAPIEIIDIYNANWQLIYNCRGTDCGNEVALSNLSSDTYHINIQAYTENWEYICRKQLDIEVTGNTSGADKPDLTLSNLRDLPSTAEQGSVQTFSFDLNNVGGQTANGTYRIDFYLVPQPGVTSSDRSVGSIDTGNTPVGTTSNVTGAITVPNYLPPGLYYLIGFADNGAEIEEENETNNFVVSNENQRIEVTSSGNNMGGVTTISCNEIAINYGNGTINMNGQSGTNYFFKVHDLNNGWAEIYSCSYNCGSNQSANNIPNGDYLVRVYNDAWGLICEQDIELNDGGIPPPPPPPSSSCAELIITANNNSIRMEGQSGESYFFKVHDLNNSWAEVFSCSYNCGSNQTANNLPDGNYLARIYNSAWDIICEQAIDLNGSGTNPPPTSGNCPMIPAAPTAPDFSYRISNVNEANKTVTVDRLDNADNVTQTNTYSLDIPFIFNQDFSTYVKVFDDHILVGITGIFDNGTFKYILLKADLNGNLIWQQLNDYENGSNEQLANIIAAKNGGYYLKFLGQGRQVLVGTDGLGLQRWQQSITPLVFDKYFIELVGEVSDGSAFYVNVYEDNFLLTLQKRNAEDGSIIWSQILNTPGEQRFPRPFTLITPDDGVIIRYTWRDRLTPSTEIDGFNYRAINTNGETVWVQDLPQTIFSFDQTPDLLVIDGAFYLNAIGTTGDNDLYSINDDGSLSACEEASSRNQLVNIETFTLYPNPAQEDLFIDLQEFKETGGQISITNMYGQIIQQQKLESIPDGVLHLSLDGYTNGVYFVHFRVKNRRVKSEKFLVKRLY